MRSRKDLIFEVNYLGGSMPTFALNFSRSGSNVIAQYYQLIRLGFEGYRRVQQACQDTAMHLSSSIAKLGPFRLLTDGSELPVFAFTVDPDAGYSVYDVSDALRKRGWQVPAYSLCANLEHMSVLRVVVRNGFSRDLSDLLVDDLKREVSAAQARRPGSRSPRGPRSASTTEPRHADGHAPSRDVRPGHHASDAEVVLRPADIDEARGAQRRLRPSRQVGADLDEQDSAGLEPRVRVAGEPAHQSEAVVGVRR